MIIFYCFLIVAILTFIYVVYIRKHKELHTAPLSDEEQFIEELFEHFGGDSLSGYLFIQRPKSPEDILLCKQICEKYGFNYYMLFKNIRKYFWNYCRYYEGWHAHFDKGTLTLVKLKPGETNLK